MMTTNTFRNIQTEGASSQPEPETKTTAKKWVPSPDLFFEIAGKISSEVVGIGFDDTQIANFGVSIAERIVNRMQTVMEGWNESQKVEKRA